MGVDAEKGERDGFGKDRKPRGKRNERNYVPVAFPYEELQMDVRQQLVSVALEWQRLFGVAPQITSAVSEYDAAILIGCQEEDYSRCMQGRTAVARGADFVYNGKRYQVKGNRPSGLPGSLVTWVPKANNYDWDFLIWILYSTGYEIREAWLWPVDDYRTAFDSVSRISPEHMRRGRPLK